MAKKKSKQPANEVPLPPLLADGLEEGFVGSVHDWVNGGELAVYDIKLCVKCLRKQGMSESEAYEFMDFNVIGAWAGPGTPLFLHRQTLEQFEEEQTRV